MKRDVFDELKAYCPKGFVTRKDVERLTGGSIKGLTLRRLDSEGKGIAKRRKIGNMTVYDIDDFIEWLRNNTQFINFDEKYHTEEIK